MTTDGRVKVGDFGIARLAESSTDGASATVVGTPRYMAPEQARGRRVSPATDVYSVGIVLYEMLAGRPPFTERSAVELAMRHLNDQPAPLPPATPPGLQEIVAQAVAKQPVERYRDGVEMAFALVAARLEEPVRSRSGLVRRPRPRARRRSHTPSAAPPTPVPAIPPGRGDRGRQNQPPPPRERPSLGRPPGRRPPASGPRTSPPPSTRMAPRFSRRRNTNPPGRRRAAAALGLAFVLLAAMIVVAVAVGTTGHVRVPRLSGLKKSAVKAKARRLSLQPSFSHRYSGERKGTVIAQRPRPGTRLTDGSSIAVVLSAGPRPVKVPQLAGELSSDAQAALSRVGLKSGTTLVVAPGVPGGTVTSQSPAPGSKLTPGSRVSLNIAEVPQWRPLTTFSGSDGTRLLQFRVRGLEWRVVYTMGYVGTCTFVIFCSGPSAQVTRTSGSYNVGFGLNDGDRQTRVFQSGPGVYRLQISPGNDTARWSMSIEDHY
jgi:hypothetical protein